MTSCHLQSNYDSKVTLHGGPASSVTSRQGNTLFTSLWWLAIKYFVQESLTSLAEIYIVSLSIKQLVNWTKLTLQSNTIITSSVR